MHFLNKWRERGDQRSPEAAETSHLMVAAESLGQVLLFWPFPGQVGRQELTQREGQVGDGFSVHSQGHREGGTHSAVPSSGQTVQRLGKTQR